MSTGITGHRPLSESSILEINMCKELEKQCMRNLDKMLSAPEEFNSRWAKLAKDTLQTGFMMMVRSIAKPEGDE